MASNKLYEGKPINNQAFDEPQLIIIKKATKKKEIKKKNTGGDQKMTPRTGF